MSERYRTNKQLNLPEIAREVLQKWENEQTFQESIRSRPMQRSFTFYEGPPSANGRPGIHHVMARALKDIVCRFKTQDGYRVERKAGWDTHGLPVELQVEKELGITKDDIGKKISVEDYNAACRSSVMRFTDVWNELTRNMGYWVDMDHPYITYTTPYMESVWWLVKQFYNRNLLYKGYTIQPYSPAAGTGLSTHELNQPGAYRSVKDVSMTAMFKLNPGQYCGAIEITEDVFCLAWTTTPWTLPSNTALAVGADIEYCFIETINPYTGEKQTVILAKDLIPKFFQEEGYGLEVTRGVGTKVLPWYKKGGCFGKELLGLRYEQLLPYAQPENGDSFVIIAGDFVRTDEGTGIVHIAPSFGSDDFRVANREGVGSLTLVDSRGRFTDQVSDFAGEFVKSAYAEPLPEGYESVDIRIAVKLKSRGRAFKIEKYEHSYPHCWRTDKPILYYPTDSWFIRTTALRERLIALNKTIQWKPESTGTGRFGNWLENLVDWNLSRSRYWGIPLPIWRSKDQQETLCIGSVEELIAEVDKAVAAGIMQENPLARCEDGSPDLSKIDLHRHVVDGLVLCGREGEPLYRENDLLDVWFDSGAMPYAQWHYPFENREKIDSGLSFPADFIAEGVDQTRGWFFTLHVIAAGVFDSVAFKSVISNGLVLDKLGQKMSKRLGNAVDPFVSMELHGADALRWYMITNASPWDNLKFDEGGIDEVKRKFFGTLYNTYQFFALYANVDDVNVDLLKIDYAQLPEFDRWILSRLRSVNAEVYRSYTEYEFTQAGRSIQDFVTEELSNWYVRLSRRRFWKGQMNSDKEAAYFTLHMCLKVVCSWMAPIAPFFSDWLFERLHPQNSVSVHLVRWPDLNMIPYEGEMEIAMQFARRVSSLALSLRKREKIRVRQPLRSLMIPVSDAKQREIYDRVARLIEGEVNVKKIEWVDASSGIVVKKVKPDFKKLGPRFGKQMKTIAEVLTGLGTDEIHKFEQKGHIFVSMGGEEVCIDLSEVSLVSEDIPGWVVASEDGVTVAMDTRLDLPLKQEGLARDLVNRIQNLRKELGYNVTDRISIHARVGAEVKVAIENNLTYICSEVLALELNFVEDTSGWGSLFCLDEGDEIELRLTKI